MNKISLFLMIFLSASSLGAGAHASDFTLSSRDIKEGGVLGDAFVFNGFGCSGKNMSPSLAWKNAPKDTQSFAITMYDPDAPTGSGWWHWTIFNIPRTTTSLKRGASTEKSMLPPSVRQGRTDFGSASYGGACPPVADAAHRYIFTVYALKTDKLDLDENASGALVGFYLRQNMIDKASLMVTYDR